jgi:hypothetical protein
MNSLIAGLLLFAPVAQDDLIANVREALRSEGPAWKSTVLTGKSRYYGEQGTFTLQFEPEGKFVQTVTGPLGESYGSDGKNYWEADRSGATRFLNFADVDTQQAFFLVQTNSWLSPPAGVKVTSDANTVRITLASGLEEVLSIDPVTHLPSTATYAMSSGDVTIKLSDWRPAGEWKIPFKTEITMGGLTDKFEAESAKEGAEIDYSIPKWTPSDVTFDPSKAALLESKKLQTGHIVVHPLVNGKDVGWFVLDSGADIMVIDPAVADGLALPKIGELALVGVGGVIQESFRTVDEFKLGSMSLKDMQCAELDLSVFKKMFGIEVAGIVGYDVFRRTIIGVDLNRPVVTLHDPAKFTLARGTWTSTMFSAGNIVVEAKMEGDRVGWYRLDTGANGTVQFHAPYVVKERLLDNRQVYHSEHAGAGGKSSGKAGTIEWFELAGHRFEKPEAAFSQATVGAFNDRYLAGNIGQDFMKPFTMYFDFGGSRVAFVPKA